MADVKVLLYDDTLQERALALVAAWRECRKGDVVQLHTGLGNDVESGQQELAIGIGIRDKIYPFRLSEAKHVLKLMETAWDKTCEDCGPSPNGKPELMLAMEEAIAECGKEMN